MVGRSVVAEERWQKKNLEKKDPRRTARHDGIERANGTQSFEQYPGCSLMKRYRADVSNAQLRTFDERLRTRWIRSGPKKRKRRGDVDVVEIHDDLDDLIATGV